MNIRENFLRTLEFKKPEWIPCIIGLPWIVKGEEEKYRKKLDKIKKQYEVLLNIEINQYSSILFEGVAPAYRIGEFTDSWGCIWRNETGHGDGMVVKNPLRDWDSFKNYRPPDPLKERINEWGDRTWNWVKIEQDIKDRRKEGKIIWGNGERLFDRLYFIRGFENLMMDFATGEPKLVKLIEMLWEYETKLIDRWLKIGVDIIWFHTDIGTQRNLMIKPEMFREYLKPMFKDLFSKCRKAGVHVYLSTDGRVIDIVDDFIDCGISIHDPQTGAISNEEIVEHYKGKIAIYLDLDRQKFSFYKPAEIDNIIKESVSTLSSPEGGLAISAGVCDPIPVVSIENIEAICKAFMKYCY